MSLERPEAGQWRISSTYLNVETCFPQKSLRVRHLSRVAICSRCCIITYYIHKCLKCRGRLVQWKNTRFVKFSFTRGLGFDTRCRISLFRRNLVSRISHKCLTEISNIKTDKRQLRNLQELETAVVTHILLYEGECSPENWSYDIILVCGKMSYKSYYAILH